jgi:Tfp pilus assembly protein PilF
MDNLPDEAMLAAMPTVNVDRSLQEATGYFQLGMFDVALEEVEALAPEIRNSTPAAELEAAIYCETKDWSSLRKMAAKLVIANPADSQNWIWLGYATRRCESITAAEKVLLDALQVHDSEPMIHFNLACYAAQNGELGAARERLFRAIALDPDVKQMALYDPDLEPLRIAFNW